MSLPTFVIAGAQKCGTSSLAAMVRQHPQVFMATPKELHYFDWRHGKGLDWYIEHFTPGPKQIHSGEASPVYMYDAVARQRMKDTIPDASILAIVRDPVKRAYSHYWHSIREGYDDVPTFEEAIELEPKRLASGERTSRIRHSYVDRGRYVEQLAELELGFGRDRLHVLLLEDLIAHRVETLEKVFAFLKIRTAAASRVKERWQAKYRTAGEKEKPIAHPPINPETREMLIEQYRPYNDRLAEWMGRDLSAWNVV